MAASAGLRELPRNFRKHPKVASAATAASHASLRSFNLFDGKTRQPRRLSSHGVRKGPNTLEEMGLVEQEGKAERLEGKGAWLVPAFSFLCISLERMSGGGGAATSGTGKFGSNGMILPLGSYGNNRIRFLTWARHP